MTFLDSEPTSGPSTRIVELVEALAVTTQRLATTEKLLTIATQRAQIAEKNATLASQRAEKAEVDKSYCIRMSESQSPLIKQLRETNEGLQDANRDLNFKLQEATRRKNQILATHIQSQARDILDEQELEQLASPCVSTKSGVESKKRKRKADKPDSAAHPLKKPKTPAIVQCTQCYIKKWACDGQTPCTNCIIRNKKRSCKRVKCKNFRKGECKDGTCTFAHESDGYTYLVDHMVLKQQDGWPTEPSTRLGHGVGGEHHGDEGQDDHGYDVWNFF